MPLIIPSFFGVPLYIFLLRQFFLGLPTELLDSASAPSGNFDLVFQQGGGRMVGRLRSLAKSAKALRLPTIQANL
ncbi:hypothetical protein ACFQ49_17550 [Kroppenstedtia eburnea]|uniref:hypothetical protein n=1 Tax=Kroppenstedtia eburnea TaxID=714067 RepID=UPI001F25C2C7|nr:hypothetical protein [Kroppenstedtia eburnea]